MSADSVTPPSSDAGSPPRGFAEQHPCRILVADDSPVNRKIIQRMFVCLGYEPAFVANGREAVDALLLTKVDLVLMDVEMPVLDGLAATETIRRELRAEAQPVIVGLTAHTSVGTRERLLAAGMNEYLPKPFTQAQLSELVMRLAELRLQL